MTPGAPVGADLVVHRGRRGRVAVLRIRGAVDHVATGRWAVEQAVERRVRWLVLDLGDEASRAVGALDVGMLVRRLTPNGVGLAVAGDHRSASRSGRPACPVFPTVPIALGTLGASTPDAVSRTGDGRPRGTGSAVGAGSPSRAAARSR